VQRSKVISPTSVKSQLGLQKSGRNYTFLHRSTTCTAFQETIDERGKIVKKPIKQSLLERLEVVPSLLARAVEREYKLPVNSSPFKKLLRTIERRDAIVHPRWDKYVAQSGWWEAAEAIDAIELYLNSIASCMHPYLVGYFSVLYTIPGRDKHEVAVGHRTYGKRGPNRKAAKMEDVGISEVLVSEWFDSVFLTDMAFEHDCEGDSSGSMLTVPLSYSCMQWSMHN